MAPKHRVTWPEGKICGICFWQAARTYGICAGCGVERLTPGIRPNGARLCVDCAGIHTDFTCHTCGTEADLYRRHQCARCALRDDLHELLVVGAYDPAAMGGLVAALVRSRRPESIFVWKRSPQIRTLLMGLASGAIPLSHEGLDAHGAGRHIDHVRALLENEHLIEARDPYLARFERWLEAKLGPLPPHVARPVEQFARWHHLRRIRDMTPGDRELRGPVHASKQEITETVKFLTWLDNTHHRTAATCRQEDVDSYLLPGPTTRYSIRTFFVFANKNRINTCVKVPHRQAQTRPALTQDQRLAWISELLTGTSESRPYRAAGMLLLLLAQPLVKVAALRLSAVHDGVAGMTLILGEPATPLPEPFAALLRDHAANRPNLATGQQQSPWLFPSTRAGYHLHPNTVMDRLRGLGINLRGAHNRALDDLVSELPPPVVADALGYSHQIAFAHQQGAGGTWAKYVGTAGPVSRHR